eukprot:jgi/Botrbrau1/10563/Bobra.0343s0011.1
MRSPSLAEHGQRPRPGARILGSSTRATGPIIVGSSSKPSNGSGLERLSLICRVLFSLCLAYFILSVVGSWTATYWHGQVHEEAGRPVELALSVPTAGPREGLLAPKFASDHQKKVPSTRGGGRLSRQDQFLRKPRSTGSDVSFDGPVYSSGNKDSLEPQHGVVETATIEEEVAADEREFAMHIQTHGKISSPRLVLNTLVSPPRPKELWLDRVLETIFVKIDSERAQRPSILRQEPFLNCTDAQQVTLTATHLEQQTNVVQEDLLERDLQRSPTPRDVGPCATPIFSGIPVQEPDACSGLLGIRKVALMFLTRGTLHHEATWRAWLQEASGLLPRNSLHAHGCNQETLDNVLSACTPDDGAPVLKTQYLFNIYVHVSGSTRDWTGFSNGSVFFGRDIPVRVVVQWGKHNMVDATRALLAFALADKTNEKFVLLSESGVPLYSAATMYAQLMTEKKSRINACALEADQRPIRTHMLKGSSDSATRWWDRHPHRWVWKMRNEQFEEHHWRKSSQWWALSRKHAEAIVEDVLIDQSFRKHCYSTIEEGWWRDCFSDEHYFASLLAAQGRDNETDCKGFMMNVDWSRGGAHPRSYSPAAINPELFFRLRLPEKGCDYPAAIRTSLDQFVHINHLSTELCQERPVAFAGILGPHCPLFARKFPASTAELVASVLANCSNRLRITHGFDCPTDAVLLGKNYRKPEISTALRS